VDNKEPLIQPSIAIAKLDENKDLKVVDIKALIANDMAMLDDPDKVEYHVKLSRLKSAIEEAQKGEDYRDELMNGYESTVQHLNGEYIVGGAKLSKGATHTKYVFDNCGHPVLEFLYNIQDKFKVIVKEIENDLKNIPPAKPTSVGEGEIKMVGGFRRVLLESPDVIEVLGFVIDDAQALIDTLDGEPVYKLLTPEKVQTFGVKMRGK